MAPSRETSLLLDQVMKGFSMTILVVFLGGMIAFLLQMLQILQGSYKLKQVKL